MCPGSLREEAKYPDPGSGAAAKDGTRSHTVLDYCIKHNLIGPMHLVGTSMSDKEGTFVVDQDRAKRVEIAVDYIRSRRDSYESCEILAEETVNPEWLLARPDMFGTVDVQVWGGNVYELIDYKDGMGIVEAKDNHQLEQYAYGVLSKFKLQFGEDYPFDTIRMTIIQPKLALKGMPAITSHDVSVIELLLKTNLVRLQAAATDLPDAVLTPGEKQCKFCRAKGACSALAGNVMKEVGLMFSPIATQSLDLAQQSADKDPSSMTDDQLRQILEAVPLLKQLIEGAEKEAQRRLEAGIPVPGFKLVRGRGSRSWAFPEEDMVKKLTGMGIPKGSVYETKLVSPAKVEKLVWEKKGIKTQLSDRQIKTLEKEYIAKSSGGLTIAPESDNREAVVMNAAPMFSAIPAAPVEVPAVPAQPEIPSWLRM